MARGVFGGGVALNKHAPIGVCMVVDCNGKSLYRGPSSYAGRGFCRKHKNLAVRNRDVDAFAAFVEADDRIGGGWMQKRRA